MSTETETRDDGSPATPSSAPFHLEKVESYRQVPILHLLYDCPTALDRASHEAEIRRLLEIEDPRFGLIICFRNISFASDYSQEAQAEVYHSQPMAELRKRAVCIARYNPGSLVSLIRTMSAHIYARQGMAADFAPDFDTALRAVRRGIDRSLIRT